MNNKCAVCGSDARRGFTVSSVPDDWTLQFCSRVHLVEFLAPELKNACSPKQWIPTPDEEERMSQ